MPSRMVTVMVSVFTSAKAVVAKSSEVRIAFMI
jgi:hypothetical protein